MNNNHISITDIISDDILKGLNDTDIKKIKDYIETLKAKKDESLTSPCLRKGCRDISTCCGCPEYTEWKRKYQK